MQTMKKTNKTRRLSNETTEYLNKYMRYNNVIPENFLSVVLKSHPEWNPNRVNNVRYGKTADIVVFNEIIKLTGI